MSIYLLLLVLIEDLLLKGNIALDIKLLEGIVDLLSRRR
jgi:hypothetical protein